jgi:hypothetical protein
LNEDVRKARQHLAVKASEILTEKKLIGSKCSGDKKGRDFLGSKLIKKMIPKFVFDKYGNIWLDGIYKSLGIGSSI